MSPDGEPRSRRARTPCGACLSCRRGRPWYCFDSRNAAQPMTPADGTPLSPALGIGAFTDHTLVAATCVDAFAKMERGDVLRSVVVMA